MTPETLETVLDVLDMRKRELERRLESSRRDFREPIIRKMHSDELARVINAIAAFSTPGDTIKIVEVS